MTKWAAADVPVRIPRAVVAVPVEGAIVDTVVHVTPGNDQPLVSLHPTILFISCSHFRRHPSSMIFPLYFSFAGRFHGGGNPPCPPRNGYFRPRGRPPMSQYEYPEPLSQFRAKGPPLTPLSTRPPERTSSPPSAVQ